nr:unnamed protein product [Callosobruchus analis]
MTMANPKSYNELRPLTDEELEALAVPLSSSDDEDDQCSGTEVEDNLENYFSPSESEYNLIRLKQKALILNNVILCDVKN